VHVTGAGDDAGREPDWQRRRRLAEVFGEVLPESTRDDRDEAAATGRRGDGPGDGAGDGVGDRWLREQVPPHHGG
jgi:hypothetical protein